MDLNQFLDQGQNDKVERDKLLFCDLIFQKETKQTFKC